MRIRSGYRTAASVALVLGTLAGTAAPVAATATVEPVAQGFVGPLGLAVRADGNMFVAESFAGQVTSVTPSGRTRTVYAEEGSSISGIAVERGRIVFTNALFPEDGEEPEDTTVDALNPSGKATTIASMLDYEERVNPDQGQSYGFLDATPECQELLPDFVQTYPGIVESNPYAVAIDPGTHRRADRDSLLVADAAGNSIVRVAANGRELSTVAVLPPVPQLITAEVADEFGLDPCVVGQHYYGEAVPTDVEVGPDGHYYVTSLPGGPELPGTGSVWRIHATTGALTQAATGFDSAVDLAVAPDGRIYVAELFAGRISVVDHTGAVSTVVEVDTPGAIEVTPTGRIYATTGVFSGPGGSVVRINP